MPGKVIKRDPSAATLIGRIRRATTFAAIRAALADNVCGVLKGTLTVKESNAITREAARRVKQLEERE